MEFTSFVALGISLRAKGSPKTEEDDGVAIPCSEATATVLVEVEGKPPAHLHIPVYRQDFGSKEALVGYVGKLAGDLYDALDAAQPKVG
jgi:hypothetical protein